MANEITVANNQLEEQVDFKAKATEWLQNMGTQLPPAQAAQFLELCQAYKLNPFKREIYAVCYGNKFNIIFGYEVYLKRADRTGKLDGWQCVVNDDGTKAKITIWRKDWSYPFEHVVFMDEVRQNSPIWQKMPTFMMRKVCVEQGMRLAFPDEMGGMPYGEEEVSYDRAIQTETEVRNITPGYSETEQAAVPNNDTGVNDDRQVLKEIIEKHEAEMNVKNPNGNPYEMACRALAENDTEQISRMLVRVKVYLSKKGVQVA